MRPVQLGKSWYGARAREGLLSATRRCGQQQAGYGLMARSQSAASPLLLNRLRGVGSLLLSRLSGWKRFYGKSTPPHKANNNWVFFSNQIVQLFSRSLCSYDIIPACLSSTTQPKPNSNEAIHDARAALPFFMQHRLQLWDEERARQQQQKNQLYEKEIINITLPDGKVLSKQSGVTPLAVAAGNVKQQFLCSLALFSTICLIECSLQEYLRALLEKY